MRRRILFLGCGLATRLHSRILSRHRGLQLFFASRDHARAERYRREFGGVASFASYEQGVAHDVDVVVVATPPALHLEHTERALAAGRHVVVEKPAFMHSSDADRVETLATAHARRVFVAENYAYKPITLRVFELVSTGALGDVRFVSLNATKRQARRGWRREGGALFEGGIHWVSFAASLGLDIESVHGYSAGSDDSSLVVFRYANGAVGVLSYSWELPAPLGGLRMSKVQGTHGAVTFESNGLGFVVTGRRKAISFPAFGDPTGAKAMWSDFFWSLDSGAEPRYTIGMARRDLRHIEAASGTPARQAAVRARATSSSAVSISASR